MLSTALTSLCRGLHHRLRASIRPRFPGFSGLHAPQPRHGRAQGLRLPAVLLGLALAGSAMGPSARAQTIASPTQASSALAYVTSSHKAAASNPLFTTSSTTASRYRTEQVQVELLAHAPEGVRPGARLWLGLLLQHEPHWHTYWQNPGDSGLPTELNWTLPTGWTAGEVLWPRPQAIPVGPLMNYGFEGRVLLAVPVTVPSKAALPAQAREALIQLQARWLVCRTECIPQEAQLQLKLPLDAATVHAAQDFEALWASQPEKLPRTASAQAELQAPNTSGDTTLEQKLNLRLRVSGLPAAVHGQSLTLLPITPEVVAHAQPLRQAWQNGVWQAEVPISATRSSNPASLAWLLMAGGTGAPSSAATATATAWQFSTPVRGEWPGLAAPTTLSPDLQEALARNAQRAQTQSPGIAAAGTTGPTLWATLGVLLGAVLGGLLLNLMPCVFPVLAIKALSFAAPGSDLQAQRRQAWAYSAGGIAAFTALGAVLLALRSAGHALGWGFQLQSPLFVLGLCLLFAALALNLFDVFSVEFSLPSESGKPAGRERHPLAQAFFSGVLAVVVASPCTAPFMGASLGVALSQSALLGLAIFVLLGVGLVLPFLLLSLFPRWAERLPRPGPWMQTLRQLLAFPLLLTVVWLLWVLGQQLGASALAAALALLVVWAWALWLWGMAQNAHRLGQARSRVGMLRSAAVLAPLLTAWAFAPWLGLAQEPVGNAPPAQAVASPSSNPAGAASPDSAASGASATSAASTIQSVWQPWTAERVAEALVRGQTVFVDFTAAWCITCQVNKLSTLSQASVLREFQNKNVLLLRADWTQRDAYISQALTRLGRSGVPAYALYRPGQAQPELLPEVLTPQLVIEALQR